VNRLNYLKILFSLVKLLRKLLFLIVLVLLSCFEASATHIVGGVINYVYLGGSTYRVTMRIYRDCSSSTDFDGIGRSPDALLGLFYESTNVLARTYDLGAPVVTSVIPTITNPCMSTTGVCLEEGVYTTDITVPNSTSAFYLSYVRCCRNSSVTNIVGAGTVGATFTVRIPPYGATPNSNPVYNAFPPVYICQNAPLVFNHSATDANGDSLYYELCNPFLGGSTLSPSPGPRPAPYTPLTFLAPYTATDPLGSSPPPAVALTIDPATGVLTGTPPTLGQFTVGICVHEFRGGIELSSTMRDFQFNVVNCPFPTSNIPSSAIDPLTGVGTFSTNCDNYTVRFTNSSSGATRYHWDFGVASLTTDTSNLTNPTYVYTDTGTYLVTLVAYNALGCFDTTYAYVKVYPGLIQDFNFTNECVDTTVQFYDASYTPFGVINYWRWTFGDGGTSLLQSPSHLYASPGAYTVNLQVKTDKGCDKNISKRIVIDPKPIPNFINDSSCINSPVAFTNTTTISSGAIAYYDWNFGDGSPHTYTRNTTHTYALTGTYNVTLIVRSDSGCLQQITRAVTIFPRPIITTSRDTTICPGTSTQIAASGGLNYYWTPATRLSNTRIANPIANPLVNTTYRITISDVNRCQSFDSVTVNLFINNTNFNFTNECKDTLVQFNDLSTSTGGIINQWRWSFGDATTASIQNPSHLYSSVGLFSVKLVITTDIGCKDSTTKTVRIYPIPQPGFINDSTCINSAVYFRDTTRYYLIGDTINSRIWSWGDGSPNTIGPSTTSHAYTTSGTFPVTLTVRTDSGCTQFITRNIVIYPRPLITTSNDTFICPGSSTQIAAAGGINYVWSPSTRLSNTRIANPIANPTSNITYYVTVADTNRCQSFDSVKVNLYINTPNFSFTNECKDTAVAFFDLSTTTGGTINQWNWTFGDAATSAIQNPNHLYGAAGLFNVKLIFTSDRGCKDSTTKTVRIYPIPRPGFINDSACINSAVYFRDTTRYYLIGDTINSRVWSWGDGSPNTIGPSTTSHAYTTSGSFAVTLTVRTDSGCTQSATRSVFINPLPTIVLTPDTIICPNTTLQLLAAGGTNFYWKANLSLNDTTINNPIASPPSKTTYYVRVKDVNRCQNSDSVTIDLYRLSPVSAGIDTSVCLNPSSFRDSVHLNASGGVSYLWVPAYNISNVNIANPWASPDTATNYTAKIGDINGCFQYDTVLVSVLDPTLDLLTAKDTFLCKNDTIQIRVIEQGVSEYTWSPAVHISSTSIRSPDFYPTDTATYFLTVINYCYTKRDTMKFNVYPLPIVRFITDTTCINSAVNFTNLSIGNIRSWIWNFGDDSVSNLQNPIHTYSSALNYAVRLIDTTNLGCYDSLTRTITIHPRPLISITPDTNLCPGEYTSLLASGGSRYFWSPASQLSNDSIPNPTTTILSNGNYNLTVADLNSCQNYDSVKVSYYFLNPDFYFQDECIDTAVQFADSTQTDAGVVNVWRWIFDDGITSNIENPAHRYTIPKSYNVMLYVRTSEGCDTSITKVVTIFPLPSLNIPRYDSICVGESYQINADSLLKYVWDPNPTLTPWNTFNPIANPITTTNYFVTLTDSHFCVNRDSFRLKVNLLPNVNISAPPLVLCRGNSYQLNAMTTAGSYLWHQGTALDDSTILNPTLSLTDSVTYWFQVTDYHGCTNYDTVTLNVQQPVLAEAFQDSTICRGNQVQLVADGGKYFSWTPNLYLTNASIKSPISTPDSSITYIIQVSNDCFSDDTSITIIVNQLPIANAGPDNTIYRNQSTTLSGSGGLSYSWTPDNYLNRPFEAITVASPMYTTQYVLQVTDIYGCISYDSVWIYVDGQTILLLPTAFSPDGNGVNDIFRITKWLNILSLETFEIYNRWGEMVFSTSDINAGWDGTFNGREQPLSVYSWIVKARDYEGNDVVKTGNVTLLR
jgi:gliding motility-associated-like protein